jgi:SAM-dependent methyltransferase
VFNEGETDFRLCTSCGLVFRKRFPTPHELDCIYREAYVAEKIGRGSTNQESGDHAMNVYSKFIKNKIWTPEMKVLDYGAGSGALVEQLRAHQIEADGLEFAESARQFCLERREFTLLEHLDGVPKNHYQLVTMIEVIEHLTDLHGTLRQLYTSMAPNGKLLVTTPNRKGLRARIEGGHWREAEKKFHLFLFDWPSIKYHLEATGFHDLKRIIFSPVTRPDVKSLITARATQVLGISGALCVIATRGGEE